MIAIEDRVKQLFANSIETQMLAADTLTDALAKAAERLAQCLLADGKILLCGNGGSAANCMHFTSTLLNHLEVERPALPVINLASISENHHHYIFARQIQALGQEQDVLLMLTTLGTADSLLYALQAAQEKQMDTILLCGPDAGMLMSYLGPEDRVISVASESPAQIRELHLFFLHSFCDLIDQVLFAPTVG